MNHLKRTLSVLLALVMLLSLMSIAATAANLEATSWAQMKLLFEQASNRDTIYIPNYVGEITAGPDDGRLIVSGNKSITLDLNGQTINRNLSAIDVDGHVIQVAAGSTLTIIDSSGDNSGLITGGWANNGGAVNNQGTLIIEGGTFAGNQAENGGAICNRSSLTIKGGVFENNTASVCGGAIWSESTANIEDAEIKNNTAGDGGAIYLTGAANCTLARVQITGNQTTEHGGGGITNYGTLTLSFCEVNSNIATGSGGGIFNGKTLNADNTDISGNTSGDLGGGVCNYGSSSGETMRIAAADLSHCTISGNTAKDGGGIYNCDDLMGEISVTPILLARLGTVTVSGNTDIEGNHALERGGGGIRNGGLLQLKDNINVKSNTCAGNGSGIWNSSVLEMQGSIYVVNNTSSDEPLSNNVYLTAGKKITLTGALGGYIGITSEQANAVLTSGYSTYNANTDPEDVFFTNDGYVIRVNDGELRARLAQAVSYYDPISKTMKSRENCLIVDAGTTRWENDWYVVTGNVRIGSRVQVSGNVNLILTNGANLIVPKGIEVPFEANFTVWGQIEGYTTEYSEEDFNKAGELNTFEFVDNDMVVPDAENAGIGAEMTGNIIVNGGKINAQGGQYAPGIGISSPYYIDTTGITVNNGYIWAMGGDKSAGIGGGYGGTCPPLEINDGVVIAWGGGDAAAIGGGYFGYYYPITIRGGEVYAYGSPWTAGIGMGCTDGNYTGIFASDVGGGLIDIQGGKVVANCSGHNKDHPECGALVNSEHRIAEYGFNFHGGVQVYPEAKVTYVKDYILDVTSHPELHIVYRGTAAQFTEDELAERAGIMMSSDWVFIEPCDHPGATYTAVTLLPQSGHVMHCTACDLPETVEPHVFDSTGKCTLCGYQAQLVTVTFDADGGSAVSAQSVPVGEKAAKPADPEKEDFSFTGWYLVTDGNLAETPFDFETTPITANITLRAVWEPVAYPIIVVAHSLSLNGDIGVNFYVDIPDATDAAYAEFTLDGKTVQAPINLNKYRDQDGVRLYKFTCNVAAAQIDTEISGVIINGEARSKAFTYSVQTYLTEAQQTMADNAEFMALAGSLATYGYYSNELFGFDPDFQQHALFDDSGFANVTAASLADDEAQINDTADGVTYVGSSLVLRTETAIKHYFTLPAGTTLDDFTFLLGEGDTAVALTPIAAGNFYYVEIPNIASGNLGKAYTVTVLDGEGNAVNTWTYSALSYVYNVLTKAEANDPAVSAELANVSKALTLYYQAADAYFHRETV